MESISVLEFNIIKTCNMNCKGCDHFSTLADSPDVLSIETLRNDLSRLNNLGVKLETIGLLGGEPLLVKNLDEYIITCKEVYPDSFVQIITNGTLLFNLSEKVIKALKDYKVKIIISLYPVEKKNKRKMDKFLTQNGIHHSFLVFKEQFSKVLMVGTHNDEPKKYCIATTPTLENGLLYVCPISAFINKLNDRFDYHFPTGECLNIYSEEATAEKICEFVKSTIKLCKQCCPHDPAVFKWECNHKLNVQGSDWVIQEDDKRMNNYDAKRKKTNRQERIRTERIALYKRRVKKAFSLLLSGLRR